MFYVKVKNILNKLLPKVLFDILINFWRYTIINIYNFFYNRKLKKFTKPYYKSIKYNIYNYFIKISPNNWSADKEYHCKWRYEKYIHDVMIDIVEKWDICVDIWANIGSYTIFLPLLTGANWKVIAFEPIKNLYNQINDSIKYNKISNVTLFNKACSNEEKNEYIYMQEGNLSWSSLINNSKFNKKEKISSIIWDNYLLKEKKIDFIKIDTEWYELNVLLWLEKTIQKNTPNIIIEFSPWLNMYKNDDDSIKILKFLSKYYKKICIIEYNKYLDLTKTNDLHIFNNLAKKSEQINLLCIKNHE